MGRIAEAGLPSDTRAENPGMDAEENGSADRGVWRDSWRIAGHEWLLIRKEPRFLIPFLITPTILIGIQSFLIFFRAAGEELEILKLSRTLLVMLALLAPGLSVPLCADTFAGEKERNTLEILLCLPIGLGSLFWGKVLGVFPLPVLAGWMGQGLMLLVIASQGLLSPGFQADALMALLLTPAVGLFLCSVATLISLGSETVRGAAQVSGLIMLFVFFSVVGASTYFFESPPLFLACLVLLLCGSAICMLLGRRKFGKRL